MEHSFGSPHGLSARTGPGARDGRLPSPTDWNNVHRLPLRETGFGAGRGHPGDELVPAPAVTHAAGVSSRFPTCESPPSSSESLDAALARRGFERIPSRLVYPWQRAAVDLPSHSGAPLPAGAETWLRADHPRLAELTRRYSELDSPLALGAGLLDAGACRDRGSPPVPRRQPLCPPAARPEHERARLCA